ncbi:putative SAM-dependent methyltransferase [Vibrio nigripulchritudo SO65]|uniref:class I SAM-dependent methyltransferase n=1 Tax=Vibrio nigripulchritudo TaxID=28173 RepID=UPI0003B209CA|nr:class I SAM-dependent methyltransferase [Vibrio nigripulchritudo]CCN34449.1 putative SAM-dependent methyltransferase [Vibrio nigripulchritudo AM115]CCN43294.1 putative SAM-dependent methyltransferase [Vibrio nigripulchritudo FTn2]CCN63748.1 putative SAM-dependent methyltransferase [Vibrio nigripulchritudo POn4]CCN77073.1 putative SAM-dependent methyltransferase [Vibrio nigripulchritudo SO65]
MSEQYNTQVSEHYAAYRPPIHRKILQDIFPENQRFSTGLDIGCGTGTSTEALSHFCESVIGLEPSEAMLAQVTPHKNISFLQGAAESIPLGEQSIDVVSFAGSLSYAKSSTLSAELARVCRPNALIVVYDFEVKLEQFLNKLGAAIPPRSSSYNHAENFEGDSNLHELNVSKAEIILPVTSEELAHVLFSSSRRYSALVERFGKDSSFSRVVEALNKLSHNHQISIDTYHSTYRLKVSESFSI